MKNNYNLEILNKIKEKKLSIGIIGLGYVGLKLLLQFANKKFEVYGFDNDLKKIKGLKKNKSPISYIKNKDINRVNKYTKYYSDNFTNTKNCDVIIICLPTPLNSKNKPDLSHIKNCMMYLQKHLRKGQSIILESTTYPGTTEEIVASKLKKFKIGENFFVGYSPERENPGSKKFSFWNTPKIVSGYTKNCQKIVNNLYKKIVKKTIKSKKIEYAETAKIFENVYRSVNIALVNELKFILKKMKLDINHVIDLAKTKPFGFSEFRPGPGVGGHCIPIDPLYLSWAAKRKGYNTEFIELASKVNLDTTTKIFKELKKIIFKKKNKKVLIVGLSYKKNIEDTRESAGVKFFTKLLKENIKVSFLDYLAHKIELKGKIYKSIKLNYKNLSKFGVIIICSDHDFYNYEKIYKYSNLVVDLRNRYKFDDPKVIKI
ncbi:MAG: nucleotide sugar dehydrogenase [Pelagibacterales bacterium]|nr:nucleotide sugar dehydrogenase [Pelagibacterales bacterium]